ncbi:hypothetical protein CPLU01_06655 [Colletotrichum plurivorum]|uniref:Uncharacterized protein n=1 Tax=Colletotrichum plurivorum TaxID=2175906 RepID=A0A8H6NGG4_9PEZI|nr:hypothetical protein CPLU01_06655 [Colletotrichum plurivorum]
MNGKREVPTLFLLRSVSRGSGITLTPSQTITTEGTPPPFIGNETKHGAESWLRIDPNRSSCIGGGGERHKAKEVGSRTHRTRIDDVTKAMHANQLEQLSSRSHRYKTTEDMPCGGRKWSICDCPWDDVGSEFEQDRECRRRSAPSFGGDGWGDDTREGAATTPLTKESVLERGTCIEIHGLLLLTRSRASCVEFW